MGCDLCGYDGPNRGAHARHARAVVEADREPILNGQPGRVDQAFDLIEHVIALEEW